MFAMCPQEEESFAICQRERLYSICSARSAQLCSKMDDSAADSLGAWWREAEVADGRFRLGSLSDWWQRDASEDREQRSQSEDWWREEETPQPKLKTMDSMTGCESVSTTATDSMSGCESVSTVATDSSSDCDDFSLAADSMSDCEDVVAIAVAIGDAIGFDDGCQSKQDSSRLQSIHEFLSDVPPLSQLVRQGSAKEASDLQSLHEFVPDAPHLWQLVRESNAKEARASQKRASAELLLFRCP